MVRRVASQVHKQASRLLKAGYLKREPAWFQAVLDHPPLPLPARAPPSRSEFDLPRSLKKPAGIAEKPLEISYLEDELRKQFFRDHPFEAFRPTSLVEGREIEDEHPVRGKAWTRLRQRTRNPKPEDAVRFALNLHQHHEMPLSRAYATSVGQFRSLRSEQEVATMIATLEAEHYGAEFRPTETERGFNKELEALKTWQVDERYDQNAIAARKRWKAVAERGQSPVPWTAGQEYVRLWKEGIRPNYSAALTGPVSITPAGLESNNPDFMQVLQKI